MAVPDIKAWLIGIAIIWGSYGIRSIMVWLQNPMEIWMFLQLTAPAIAAFVIALLAENRKIMLAMSMAPLAAFLESWLNALYQLQGRPVDFSGLQGAMIVITISLIYSLVICTPSAVCGWFIANKWLKNNTK